MKPHHTLIATSVIFMFGLGAGDVLSSKRLQAINSADKPVALLQADADGDGELVLLDAKGNELLAIRKGEILMRDDPAPDAIAKSPPVPSGRTPTSSKPATTQPSDTSANTRRAIRVSQPEMLGQAPIIKIGILDAQKSPSESREQPMRWSMALRITNAARYTLREVNVEIRATTYQGRDGQAATFSVRQLEPGASVTRAIEFVCDDPDEAMKTLAARVVTAASAK